MRLYYTIHQALDYLKGRIEEDEAELKKARGKWEKKAIEQTMFYYFERGLNILSYAKPGEADPELIDWFLGRIKERPDLSRLKDKMNGGSGCKKK